MPRGGSRKGAGRKPGQRDKKPRTRAVSTAKPKQKDVDLFDRFNKGFYLKLKPMLTASQRKEYESLVGSGEEPVECLKFLLQDLMVRYKKGRVMEIRANRTWEGISKVVDNITKVADTINRIESERPSAQVNVLMLLTDATNEAKARAVGDALFADPEDKKDVIDIKADNDKDKKVTKKKPKKDKK